MFSNVSYHAKAIDQREVRYGQSVYSNAIMHSFNSEQYNGAAILLLEAEDIPFLVGGASRKVSGFSSWIVRQRAPSCHFIPSIRFE